MMSFFKIIPVVCLFLFLSSLYPDMQGDAKKRTVLRLLDKISLSLKNAQKGIESKNKDLIEHGLGNAYVQTVSALVKVRLEQNCYSPLGEILDISQEKYLAVSSEQSFRTIRTLVQQAKKAYQSKQPAETEDRLLKIVTAIEFTYFQQLQNGEVNPEGVRVAGVGACFEQADDIAYMAGVIDDRILRRVSLLLNNSRVQKIVMVNVPGSNDDDSNLTAALKLHRAGIETRLMEGGSIESGGVDFFLAGKNRSIGKHFNIGVHSWKGGRSTGYELRFDRGHHDHYFPFLQYYHRIGISDRFYFFTLSFRPQEMHYMTTDEVRKYGVL